MSEEAWQQGEADGLCGIYAIANFLRSLPTFSSEKNKPDGILFYVLEVVEQLGWLRPHYITSGFAEHHLRAISDRLISYHELPFRTELIKTDRSYENGSPFDYISWVVREGGAAIIDSTDKSHWVLARGVVSGKLQIWDSDAKSSSVRCIEQADVDGVGRRKRPNGLSILRVN